FGINTLLITVRLLVFHAQREYIDTMLKIAQAVGYNPADPEIQAAVRNLFTPEGLVLTIFFGMIFTVALAALGAGLAASAARLIRLALLSSFRTRIMQRLWKITS